MNKIKSNSTPTRQESGGEESAHLIGGREKYLCVLADQS